MRFNIQPPNLFCAHCHCGYCRLAHGAAFVAWVGAADEQFELNDPGGRLVGINPQNKAGGVFVPNAAPRCSLPRISRRVKFMSPAP